MPQPRYTISKILNDGIPWPSELKPDKPYERSHDDHDGSWKGKIIVNFGIDGDAWVLTDSHTGPPLRFRTVGGGTHSPRVRNALLLLALAIKLDSDERPDPK